MIPLDHRQNLRMYVHDWECYYGLSVNMVHVLVTLHTDTRTHTYKSVSYMIVLALSLFWHCRNLVAANEMMYMYMYIEACQHAERHHTHKMYMCV